MSTKAELKSPSYRAGWKGFEDGLRPYPHRNKKWVKGWHDAKKFYTTPISNLVSINKIFEK